MSDDSGREFYQIELLAVMEKLVATQKVAMDVQKIAIERGAALMKANDEIIRLRHDLERADQPQRRQDQPAGTSEPLTAVVNGRTWRTYTCSYDTADGKFCFTIMAISMEHAAAMLEELKATAKLDGELDSVIPCA